MKVLYEQMRRTKTETGGPVGFDCQTTFPTSLRRYKHKQEPLQRPVPNSKTKPLESNFHVDYLKKKRVLWIKQLKWKHNYASINTHGLLDHKYLMNCRRVSFTTGSLSTMSVWLLSASSGNASSSSSITVILKHQLVILLWCQ